MFDEELRFNYLPPAGDLLLAAMERIPQHAASLLGLPVAGASCTRYACTRVNRAATRPDGEYLELQTRMHERFVREERMQFNNLLPDGDTDPKMHVGMVVVDGYDSCKTTIPALPALAAEHAHDL
jgi:hypothetical protein